jgi:acetyl esterase/lipase
LTESPFHPDLRRIARVLPRGRGEHLARVARVQEQVLRRRPGPGIEIVQLRDAPLRLHHAPARRQERRPALLWLHGGGYVGGSAAQDDKLCQGIARELGIIVAAVDYRCAPKHAFPAALHDSNAALSWLAEQHDIDVDRIAVGGASAGGGIAAALALLARERGEIRIAFQLLSYPMLDDRTVIRTDIDERHFRLWNNRSNAFGWRSYLGAAPGSDGINGLAAPGRHVDLAGLPPSWIGVGTLDLFFDEDVAYARRLEAEGVACQLDIVEGAFHGFDVVCSRAPIAYRYRAAQMQALRAALSIEP